MLSILPAIQRACVKEDRLLFALRTKNQWTKLHSIGLALDITLIAATCILCSLLLCVHLGLPVGSLNCLREITRPLMITLGSVAGALLLLDGLRLAYMKCQCTTENWAHRDYEPEPPKKPISDISKNRSSEDWDDLFFTDDGLSYSESLSDSLNSYNVITKPDTMSNSDIINLEGELSSISKAAFGKWEHKVTDHQIDGREEDNSHSHKFKKSHKS